jgi:hypothetical protein
MEDRPGRWDVQARSRLTGPELFLTRNQALLERRLGKLVDDDLTTNGEDDFGDWSLIDLKM